VTGLIPFPDPYSAARAISKLANGGVQSTTGVTAAEYIERRALATVEHLPAIQPYVRFFTDTSPVILIDIAAADEATLAAETQKAVAILLSEGATDIDFSPDAHKSHALWDVRKGFFATGGAARPKGTSMLTEDVAAPIDRLADFVIDMRQLLDDFGYDDAIIFGHALAGNLHFQMSDDFMDPAAAERFDRFSKALSEFVSVRYGGSLKAEHGTGRAIAPFVEAEWGTKAYLIMHEIKRLFDPEGLLNPGVLLNPDPDIHIKNLKLMPLADEIVDLCIECGFCEPACPSHHMTLSPRQRIAVTRERARLRSTGEDPARLKALDDGFQYAGLDTCAACNLCSLRCPVGIETGTMVIGERGRRRSDADKKTAHWVADNLGSVERGMKLGLGVQALSRKVVGNGIVDGVANGLHALAPKRVPRVSPALRPGPGAPKVPVQTSAAPLGKVVYFPSCATRLFGAPTRENGMLPTPDAMVALLKRAGFEVVVPDRLEGQCCGQPFQSKGFPDEAARVGEATMGRLSALADETTPVLTDASTCAKHMRELGSRPQVFDSAEFLVREILPRLSITKKLPALAVHHNCSAQRLKEQGAIEALAAAMADTVVVLDSITCCGYAGDKGLYVPELNAHATRFAKAQVPEGCRIGISTVSTCATGLTERTGVDFVSIASVLEMVSA
jgi:D-lactate dehydrogenase